MTKYLIKPIGAEGKGGDDLYCRRLQQIQHWTACVCVSISPVTHILSSIQIKQENRGNITIATTTLLCGPVSKVNRVFFSGGGKE